MLSSTQAKLNRISQEDRKHCTQVFNWEGEAASVGSLAIPGKRETIKGFLDSNLHQADRERKWVVRDSKMNYRRLVCTQSSALLKTKAKVKGAGLDEGEEIQSDGYLFGPDYHLTPGSPLSDAQLEQASNLAVDRTDLWSWLHLGRCSSSSAKWVRKFGEVWFKGAYGASASFDYDSKAAEFLERSSCPKEKLLKFVRKTFWRKRKEEDRFVTKTQEVRDGIVAEGVILSREDLTKDLRDRATKGCNNPAVIGTDWEFNMDPGFVISKEAQLIGATPDGIMHVTLDKGETVTHCIEVKYTKNFQSRVEANSHFDQCYTHCMVTGSPITWLILGNSQTSVNSVEKAAAACRYIVIKVPRNHQWEAQILHYIKLLHAISKQLLPIDKLFSAPPPLSMRDGIQVFSEVFFTKRRCRTYRHSSCSAEIVLKYFDGELFDNKGKRKIFKTTSTIAQVVRLKCPLANGEQRISLFRYISSDQWRWGDFSIWAYLRGSQSHTQWPDSDSDIVEKYGHHFGIGSSGEVPPHSLQTTVQLQVLSFVTTTDLFRAARHPEALQSDSTCKTNSELYKLNYILGADGDSKTTTFLKTFMNGETRNNFIFLFSCAMRLVYGSLLDIVTVVALDGNPWAEEAVEISIDLGRLGKKGITQRKLCYFHGVVQSFLKDYGKFRGSDDPELALDGGIGDIVLRWVKYAMFRLETPEEFDLSWDTLIKFITRAPIPGNESFVYPTSYKDIHEQTLLAWAATVHGKRREIGFAWTSHDYPTYLLMTTSRTEGENSTAKKSGVLNNRASTSKVVDAEVLRSRNRETCRLASDYKNSGSVYIDIMDNVNYSVLKTLTPFASRKLEKEIRKSQEYTVTRVAVDTFMVRLTQEAIEYHLQGLHLKPHLLTWKPPTRLVKIISDLDGKLRLKCNCRKLKSVVSICGCSIAVNMGQIGECDTHYRWTNDFNRGLYDDELLPRKMKEFDFCIGPVAINGIEAYHPVEEARLESALLLKAPVNDDSGPNTWMESQRPEDADEHRSRPMVNDVETRIIVDPPTIASDSFINSFIGTLQNYNLFTTSEAPFDFKKSGYTQAQTMFSLALDRCRDCPELYCELTRLCELFVHHIDKKASSLRINLSGGASGLADEPIFNRNGPASSKRARAFYEQGRNQKRFRAMGQVGIEEDFMEI